MSNSKKTAVWKISEKIAAIFEKSLAPQAKVRHNVLLPVIGSPSQRKRQCDVVIEYGQDPRTQIAIVEVQRRKSKPTITTFHGWIQKMREVGAQQLICVSEAGYPESIIEEVATKMGTTVILMTLKELELSDPRPVFMLPTMIYTNPKYDIVELGNLSSVKEGEESITQVCSIERYIPFEIHSEEKIFSIDNNPQLINLHELISAALGDKLQQFYNRTGVFKPEVFNVEILLAAEPEKVVNKVAPEADIPFIVITVNTTAQNIWIYYQDQRLKIREWSILIKICTEINDIPIPMTQFVYHSEQNEDALAWIANATVPVGDKNQDIQIIFKRDKDGNLHIGFDKQQISND